MKNKAVTNEYVIYYHKSGDRRKPDNHWVNKLLYCCEQSAMGV